MIVHAFPCLFLSLPPPHLFLFLLHILRVSICIIWRQITNVVIVIFVNESTRIKFIQIVAGQFRIEKRVMICNYNATIIQ